MSGKEDSKQISTPTFRRRPSGRTACSTLAPSPEIMFCGAALLMDVSQPSADLNGMYSPNGTSLVLV